MEGATANKLADQERKINLAALRKTDQFVLDILETSAQVALYKFDPVKQEWVRKRYFYYLQRFAMQGNYLGM